MLKQSGGTTTHHLQIGGHSHSSTQWSKKKPNSPCNFVDVNPGVNKGGFRGPQVCIPFFFFFFLAETEVHPYFCRDRASDSPITFFLKKKLCSPPPLKIPGSAPGICNLNLKAVAIKLIKFRRFCVYCKIQTS